MTDNRLFFGDNLHVLREHVASETVDLVYLDPPFNSNASYNVLFGDHSDRAPAQILAFEDTWHWGDVASEAFDMALAHGGRVADAMKAFAGLLGHGDMLAYLAMMAPRLVELRRVLKPTGSLYLHCDPTASHYLKVLLDAVFGPENFRTEIAWKRSSAHSDTKQGRRQHGRIHDVLLFYTKGAAWTWNAIYTAYDVSYVDGFYRHVEPGTGRRYRLDNLTGPGGAAKGNPSYDVMGVTRYWRYTREKMAQLIRDGRVVQTRPGGVPAYKRYLDEMPGVPLQDIWVDVGPVSSQAAERLGYPTQKPVALLERIIEASSNPGDMVLDPFCGCGTTIAAAQKLGRHWQGIDVTHLAVNLMKHRLRDTYGLEPNQDYAVIGEPTTVDGAAELAAIDPYGFQWWALALAGAHVASSDRKKGADGGIDGRLMFRDEGPRGAVKQAIFSVKAGHTSVAHVRDLIGVLDREGAQIGVLLSLQDPTRPMREEAAAAGGYVSPYDQRRYPRVQLLTVGELLEGRTVQMPAPAQTSVTFRRAERELPRVAEEQADFLAGGDDESGE